MRVLIVEDDPAIFNLVTEMVEELLPGRVVSVATDRDTAFNCLDPAEGPLELVVCDLKIPSSPGAADADEAHGKSVYTRMAEALPGVPCIFLSGYAGTNTQDLTDYAGRAGHALPGSRVEPVALVQLAEKDDLIAFKGRLAALAEVVNAIDAVRLEGDVDDLSVVDARALRLALMQHADVVRGNVSAIYGGMAGARTYRLDGYGAAGELCVQLFTKVSFPIEVEDELERFRAHVPGKLQPGAFASFVAHIQAFCGGTQALVLRFGDFVEGSVFDLLLREGAHLVGKIRVAVSPWEAASTDVSVSVASLRRRRLDDERFKQTGLLSRPDAVRLESATLAAKGVVCHGDLHGENALVSKTGVCLIDFGDVEPSLAGLDAVTLEMSLWTHEAGRHVAGSWPTPAAAARWWVLDDYLQECPVPEFVLACRRWALDVAGGQEEAIVAMVYAHSLRQLKYPDVDRAVALAFVEGAIERWSELPRR